jgi:two-component system invasion response regulator UvrY
MVLDVIVVEDDAFTRLSLVAALSASGLRVVYDTDNAGDALTKAELLLPHAAILDLHLGRGPTGIDVARSLRRHNPRVGIVLLTSFDDPRLLGENLPSPPAGTQYLTKRSVTSIDTVVQAVGASVRARNVSPAITHTSPLEKLTGVQIETLRLISHGLSNSEIAVRRGVTEKSVEKSITRICRSLSVDTGPMSNQRVQIVKIFFGALGVSSLDPL